MKLDTEFYRLPLRFDVERLATEISAFSEAEWRPHPTDYQGNTALILISSRGEQNDTFLGPMLPTPHLDRCPYIQQVLASFSTVFGRSRLMRLEPESQVPEHSDINYHWYYRVRIHVPIITDPAIRFHCNGRDVHMAAGEAWIFDSWKMHKVVNPSRVRRVHLVADTMGSAAFWDIVSRGERPFDPGAGSIVEPRFVPYQPDLRVDLLTEKHTHAVVMPPGEMDLLTTDLLADIGSAEGLDVTARDEFVRAVERLRREWRITWSLVGSERTGWPRYQALLEETRMRLSRLQQPLWLGSNKASALQVLQARVLTSAFNPAVAGEQGNVVDIGAGRGAARSQTAAAADDARNVQRKVGRNEPCPCGSGKKFKYCHG